MREGPVADSAWQSYHAEARRHSHVCRDASAWGNQIFDVTGVCNMPNDDLAQTTSHPPNHSAPQEARVFNHE
jgi:hypothetical protein